MAAGSSTPRERSVTSRILRWLRGKLFAGFLALFPLAATVWIGARILSFLDGLIGKYFVKWFPALAGVHGLGIVALFLLLLLTGTIVRSYVGRKAFAVYDGVMNQLPFARTVYSSIKQVLDVVAPEERSSFSGVGLIEFPRPGCWALVFVTQDGPPEASHRTGKDLVSVFMPTTPNPTSGFLMMMPRENITLLDMSIEDGMTFVISAGIVAAPWPPAVSPSPAMPDEE